MSQGIRTFRAPAPVLGIRQHVALRRQEELTSALIRPMVITLVAALLGVIALSQFLHWQIVREQGVLEQLQTVRAAKGTENMALLAERAKLTSKTHVEAVVATKMNLYLPARGQVHRL